MIGRSISSIVARTLGRLRYPWLFAIAGTLLLLDLVVPDPVPFLDEILLTVITLLLGSRRRGDGGDDADRVGTGSGQG